MPSHVQSNTHTHTPSNEAFSHTYAHTNTGEQVDSRHIHTATCLHKPCYNPSTFHMLTPTPCHLCGVGQELNGLGRLARSGALGIRVDAGSGPGARGGIGSGNCRSGCWQCVTWIGLNRLACLACRSTVLVCPTEDASACQGQGVCAASWISEIL